MKPGTASSGRICESPKISLLLPHHCGTPGVFPGCPVKGFGSSAGVPGSFFCIFLYYCCLGFQGVVYTSRVFVISIWMNFSDIRHLDIIVWLDVPGPLRSDARFLFAISLKVLRVEGFRHFHTLSKDFDKMFEKFGKSLIFVLLMNK